MSNGVGLPADIQEQLDRKEKRAEAHQSPGGIGGRAPENTSTAHQRQVAMGRNEEPEEDSVAPEAEPDEEPVTECTSVGCDAAVEAEWEYCPRCGMDLLRSGAAARLGVKFTEEDVQDYLFKGFIVRDIKILGKHTATMRTSQAGDLGLIDDLIMNGKWTKDKDGEKKVVSDFFLRQMNAMAITAIAVQKISGTSIGKDLKERVKYLEARGSAFVDLLATRVTLFNQAFTDYLKKEDSILGS